MCRIAQAAAAANLTVRSRRWFFKEPPRQQPWDAEHVLLSRRRKQAQGNSSVGTWNLNVAASKYSPGPAPKSSILKIEADGMEVNSTVDTILADGSAQHISYGGSYDGKDVAATGSPVFDMVSRRRINATTTEASYKMAGKVVTVNTVVVSADGKTLTNTAEGTDAQGRAVNNRQVFIRQ